MNHPAFANVSEIVLPGGLKTQISGIGVYYPDGRQTQRVGIVPDIVVKPTIHPSLVDYCLNTTKA